MQWKGISKAVWKVKRLHRNPSEYRNTKHHPILSWERLSYPVWIFFFLSRKPISSKIIRFKLSHHFSGISSLAPPRKDSDVLSPGQTNSHVDASQRKFTTSVQLAFRLETHSCWLWLSSSSYASRRKFFPVWPLNASRHKLIANQLYMREIYDLLRLAWTCEPTCESVWTPIASPYASLCLQSYIDLKVRFASG